MTSIKRLRIFAGPNGSGKSTLVKVVMDLNIHLGVYVNADDIKSELDHQHFIDLNKYFVTIDIEHLKISIQQTSFYDSNLGNELSKGLKIQHNCLYINDKVKEECKFPLFLADYIRNQLLNSCDKFTFETVMSHPSKLDFILKAKNSGFRIYLYFVSLEDPILNIARVEARVRQGGHDVPTDKIVSRYERTMNFLLAAIKLVDRAYLFDNSSTHPKLFAISQNNTISLTNPDYFPIWFQKYVVDKISPLNNPQ